MQFHISRFNHRGGAAFRCMVSGVLFRTQTEAHSWQAEVIDRLLRDELIGPNDTGDLPVLQEVYRRHIRPDNALN